MKAVALDKARFEVRIEASDSDESAFSSKGFDEVEFYFSANPGESPKPLAKVASGGEASRLMLILKTTAKASEQQKTAVFDEIDVGIGGRVAEAVGRQAKGSRRDAAGVVRHAPAADRQLGRPAFYSPKGNVRRPRGYKDTRASPGRTDRGDRTNARRRAYHRAGGENARAMLASTH